MITSRKDVALLCSLEAGDSLDRPAGIISLVLKARHSIRAVRCFQIHVHAHNHFVMSLILVEVQ
jgi:hypothetical protein